MFALENLQETLEKINTVFTRLVIHFDIPGCREKIKEYEAQMNDPHLGGPENSQVNREIKYQKQNRQVRDLKVQE